MADAKPKISPANVVIMLSAVILISVLVLIAVANQNRLFPGKVSTSETAVITFKSFGGSVIPEVGTRELVIDRTASVYRIISTNTGAVASERYAPTEPQAFASIISMLNDVRFFGLKDEYSAGKILPDVGTAELSVLQDGIKKTVLIADVGGEDLGTEPPELVNITNALGSIISSVNSAYEVRLKAIAEAAIRGAPTFSFDGSDLKFAGLTLKSLGPEVDTLQYTFVSSHAGYGDRTGKLFAEVVTPHNIEATITGGAVVSLITDGRWDELLQQPILHAGANLTVPPSQPATQDMANYGFSKVLSVTNIRPAQASVIAAAPYKVDVPAYTFNVPVIFEVLSGNPSDFASKVPQNETPLLAFAFHVSDAQTNSIIGTFNQTVTITATSDLIDKHAKLYVFYQNSTPARNSVGVLVSRGTLEHPIRTASVGWLVTYMPAYYEPSLNEMQYQPMQCQKTPWEGWYNSSSTPRLSPESEAAIATAYYQNVYNITTAGFDRIDTNRAVCLACDICAQGYYYTVAVRNVDIPTIADLGWTRPFLS